MDYAKQLVKEYVRLVGGRPNLSDAAAEKADWYVSAICRQDRRVAPTVAALVAAGQMPPPVYSVDDVVVVALAELGYEAARTVAAAA